MKANKKINVTKLIVPFLLVAGIVVCALLYRSDTREQISIEKGRVLFEPGDDQSRLLLIEIERRLNILDVYSSNLAETDWHDYSQVLQEINISAEKADFTYVTVVGLDAILYTDTNEAVDVSKKEYYKVARKGQRMVERLEVSDDQYFVFSVPFVVNGEREGAVVGFYTEEVMSNLLKSCQNFGPASNGSIIFDSKGNIVLETGDIPQFKDQSNIFTAIDNLSSEEPHEVIALESMKEIVLEGGKDTINTFYEGEDYDFAYQPLGINDWYILNLIDISELNRQNQKSLLLLIIVVSLAALLVINVLESSENRKREMHGEQVKLDEAISIDSLTGLFNKPGFESEAQKHLTKLPDEYACAIVSFEIVSFRSYNTLYGFEAGDALLKKIADIMLEFKNDSDVAGRLYSDHFVWLISGKDNEEIFSYLRKGVAASKNTSLPFFLCGGIYIIDDRNMPVTYMIDKASIAKDNVKHKFGTGISIYNDSMLECQLEDAELVGSMMKGLQNGEFVDYYQPKYNMDTEAITGVEELVRWKKPDGEIISPGRFIELFERNGFIRKLDFHMFEKACDMLKKAIDNNRSVVPVSVNFSRVHLYDSNFPKRIYNIAQCYSVDTKYLEIELTESAFIMDSEELNNVVEKLHEYGFTVAIDDFGSGFSSLNMLKDVSVDVLKIDMKFLEGFERGGKVGTVLTSIIRMAKWLGIPLVAEGVETKEQVDFLRTLGCDMVQGFFYSYPIPRDEYEAMINQKDTITRPFSDKPTTTTLESINAVLGGDSLVTSLVDGIFGGLGIYELFENRLEAIRVNRTYCELLGYPDMAAFSTHSLDVLSQTFPPDVDIILDTCNTSIRTGNVQKFTARRYDYYRNLRQFQGLIKHIGGTEKRPLIFITFTDATEKMNLDREIELNKYCDALTGIFDEIWEFNYRMETLFLLSANHMRFHGNAKNLCEVEENWLKNKIYLDDRESVGKVVALAKADKLVMPTTFEYRKYENGEIRWMSSSMVSVAGGSYLLCNLDITEKKQFEMLVEKIENLHLRPDLDLPSGVLNSAAVEILIKERLRKEDVEKASALIIISLDNYKTIYDTFGQETSDNLIKESATRINSMFRDHDIIGRIGEDKFIVYMSSIADSSIVCAKTMKVQEYVSSIVLTKTHDIICSIGFSIITTDDKDYVKALIKAETALREAKQSRENRCIMFDENEE